MQKQISSVELEQALKDRSRQELRFWLIDIREPYEYEASHIAGVDMLLPTSRFREWSHVLYESYRDRPIILTCRTANRTAQVQGLLMQMGMGSIINHAGGIVSYTGKLEHGMRGARGV